MYNLLILKTSHSESIENVEKIEAIQDNILKTTTGFNIVLHNLNFSK